MPEEESYWVKREKDNIKREQMKDEEVNERLQRIIYHALSQAEKEINSFYSKYAGKNKLSQSEAKRRVSEFDIQTYEEFAARFVKEKNFSGRANEELYTFNTKMRISRQELLMMYLNAHLVAMANEQITTFQEYLEQAGIAEVARQAGILGANINITQEALLAMVGASFYDATWSERIWSDMRALREEVETVVNSSIIRGVHPNRFVKDVREHFDVSVYEAKRLLITETARVQTEAQKLSYIEVGGEDAEYEYVAVLDNRTTKTCRRLDGKRFKVKDMMPGINAAPMHPFCRSSSFMVLGDWRTKFFEEREGKYSLNDSDTDQNPIKTSDKSSRLPNYEKAHIPEKKLTHYALDKNGKAPDKAIAFEKALGYNQSNYMDLINNVLEHLSEFYATPKGTDRHGQRYQVILRLTGANGKSANVLTAWIVDANTGETRLTSIYVTKKEV